MLSETDTTVASALPGYEFVEHIGLAVPDLNQASAFFVRTLGATELYRSRRTGDRAFMLETFGVDSEASFELAMLRLPPNLNIEFFEWRLPDPRRDWPRVADPGGHHICVRVADAAAAIQRLRSVPGVRVLGEMKVVGAGPVAGSRWTYFITPWGLHMEIAERSAVQDPPNFVTPSP